jgi:hypothetical protein
MRRTISSTTRRILIGFVASLVMVFGAWRAADADEWSRFFNSAGGLRVIGLTDDGRLVQFKAHSPRRTRTIGYVQGLMGSDTTLVGIDFRVQDGKLYGVANGGGVYTLDLKTARATAVNTLTVPLMGTSFGVDFNPAADRLRIVSDAGQNLAHNVNAGGMTAANGTLTYTPPPGTPAPATGVLGAAYTNNDLDAATATTLFDVDTTLDQIVIQSPPGNGVLAATGKLGVDATAVAGFDIYSRLVSGQTASNHALASLTSHGAPALYRIQLTTGRAFRLGTLGDAVIDIAIPLNQ